MSIKRYLNGDAGVLRPVPSKSRTCGPIAHAAHDMACYHKADSVVGAVVFLTAGLLCSGDARASVENDTLTHLPVAAAISLAAAFVCGVAIIARDKVRQRRQPHPWPKADLC